MSTGSAKQTMRTENNAAFLPPAAPYGTIRNETRFDPPSSLRRVSRLRRPRTAQWSGCPPCTCGRIERAVVVLRASGDVDENTENDANSDSWLSGAKRWFRPKEDANSAEGTVVDEDTDENDDDPLDPTVESNSSDTKLELEPHSAKSESQKQKFQWPWQKDDASSVVREIEERTKNEIQWPWQKQAISDSKEEGNKKNDLKGGKGTKSSHSGVKLKQGITAKTRNPLARKSDGEIKDESPLEERVGKLLDVIIPTWQKLKPDSIATDEPEESTTTEDKNGISSERVTVKEIDPEQSKAQPSNSITDLYSPPNNGSESADASSSSRKTMPRSLLPRMPWSRKQRKASSGDLSQIVPEQSVADEKVESVDANESKTVDANTPIAEGEKKVAVVLGKEKSSSADEEGEKKLEKALVTRTGSQQKKVSHVDMSSIPQRDVAMIRLIFGSETFFATETLSAPGGLIFRGNLRGEPKATLSKLEQRLSARFGDKYTLCLAEGEEDLRPVVVVIPTIRDKRPATSRQKFFALFAAVATLTACVGRGLYVNYHKDVIEAFYGPLPRNSIIEKLFYLQTSSTLTTAVSIAIVLMISQAVQRFVASRSGTRLALPYLIPSYQLGSFGVITHLASPPPSRSALFDIAISGAATVVALSLALLVIGLRMSTTFSSVTPVPISMVSSSVVIGFLTQYVPQGQILIDYSRSLIGLHPLAVIGANCLTIGALNLLPIRQIDGGRIISALYGRKTSALAARVTILFILFASSKSPFFVVFLVAITFGPWTVDRPAKNELTEPNGLRTLLGYLFMLVMIGVLLPYPRCKFFGTL